MPLYFSFLPSFLYKLNHFILYTHQHRCVIIALCVFLLNDIGEEVLQTKFIYTVIVFAYAVIFTCSLYVFMWVCLIDILFILAWKIPFSIFHRTELSLIFFLSGEVNFILRTPTAWWLNALFYFQDSLCLLIVMVWLWWV